jgi:DNA-binding transcriptional LysR family regulator
VQLLNRTSRSMTLTDAGQSFYDESNRLLADLSAVEARIVSAEAALSGRIRLAAPSVFGRRHLGPAINAFMATHPQIQFDIEFNDRSVDIIEEGFDLAVRISKLKDSRLVARRLARITATVVASPDYWDEHTRPKRPHELRAHHALQYSYYATTTWRYRAKNGRTGSVRVPTALRGQTTAITCWMRPSMVSVSRYNHASSRTKRQRRVYSNRCLLNTSGLT